MSLSERPLPFDPAAAVFHETKDSRRARAKAECTSAAVEVFKARNMIDELMLQIAEAEQQFADSDAKFMRHMTFLLGAGFKDPSSY